MYIQECIRIILLRNQLFTKNSKLLPKINEMSILLRNEVDQAVGSTHTCNWHNNLEKGTKNPITVFTTRN